MYNFRLEILVYYPWKVSEVYVASVGPGNKSENAHAKPTKTTYTTPVQKQNLKMTRWYFFSYCLDGGGGAHSVQATDSVATVDAVVTILAP